MIARAPESCSCALSWTDLSVARLYAVVAAVSEWSRCRPSLPDPSLGRNIHVRGSGTAQSLAEQSADFGRLEGVWMGRSDRLPVPCHALARLAGKATKRMTGRVPAPNHASRD